MSKKERLIFLDIDGPMIPSGCYVAYGYEASYNRKYSPICVAIINRLCHETKAKIVFNSTHNMSGYDLIDDSVREGLKFGHMYKEGSFTSYPRVENRKDAINLWLKKHDYNDSNCLWCAFDDVDFQHSNLILIDFDVGITLKHYHKAVKILQKGNPITILG